MCVCVRACCSKDLLVFFVTAFLFSCIERYIAYILYTNLYTYKTRSSIYTDCALICTMYICGRGGSRRLYRCKFQLPLRRVSSTLFSRHRCGVTRIEWCKEPSDPSRFLSTIVRVDTSFFFFFWQVNSAFISLARYVQHTKVHLRWLRNSATLRSTVRRHARGFCLVAVIPPEIAQGNVGMNYEISTGLCSSMVTQHLLLCSV